MIRITKIQPYPANFPPAPSWPRCITRIPGKTRHQSSLYTCLRSTIEAFGAKEEIIPTTPVSRGQS